MNPLRILTSNYIINAGFLAWFLAQLIKTVLAYIPSKKVNWERLVGSGGMPSSHSAFVCAIALAMGRKTGYASPEFALAIALAGIVMYDAMGVRRAAGEHAKVLNKMLIDFKELFQTIREEFDALARGDQFDTLEEPASRKKLKEFLGHTPLEVFCGAVLGIVVAVLLPVF